MIRSTCITILFSTILLVGCAQNNNTGETSVDSDVTRQVVNHHWETFVANDLDGVMADYTEESILITPDTTYKGLDAIRANFVRAFEAYPADSSTLILNKTVVEQEIGYITWEATTPDFNLRFGTDTFVIEDGKIVRQTYGGITDQQLSQ
ncbi:MAG: nuclear transport factor 2 family protein [Balneolaceae bacterium]|nr:nuclear transport factor 2 family protein [Balneolaceae bacterium]